MQLDEYAAFAEPVDRFGCLSETMTHEHAAIMQPATEVLQYLADKRNIVLCTAMRLLVKMHSPLVFSIIPLHYHYRATTFC